MVVVLVHLVRDKQLKHLQVMDQVVVVMLMVHLVKQVVVLEHMEIMVVMDTPLVEEEVGAVPVVLDLMDLGLLVVLEDLVYRTIGERVLRNSMLLVETVVIIIVTLMLEHQLTVLVVNQIQTVVLLLVMVQRILDLVVVDTLTHQLEKVVLEDQESSLSDIPTHN